jgi:hypothetical protein
LLVHERFQVRHGGTDPGTVKRYEYVLRNNAEFRDPITVAFIVPPAGKPKRHLKGERIATGTLVLLDGFHRVEAAQNVGMEELPAIVYECAEEMAGWVAATANTCNGRPLKTKEYRTVLRKYVEAFRHNDWSTKSYRIIAKDIGGIVHYGTVRNWMRDDHPDVFRILQKQGQDLDPPGGLPDEGPRVPTMAEDVTEDAVEAIRDAVKALPHLTPDQLAELQAEGLGLALDCRTMRAAKDPV